MSTTQRKPLPEATREAAAFLDLLNPCATIVKYMICGSMRRQRADVGDVDIVAIPRYDNLPNPDSLLGETVRTNLLWHRLDSLLANGVLSKHVKDTLAGQRTKWGDLSRAINYRGTCYEITLAEADNFAFRCAVATGPAELSKLFVTTLPKKGYEVRDGFRVYRCGGKIDVPTEEALFKLCGLPYRRPELR